MFSDNRHGGRFFGLIADPDVRLRLYVYRWENNRRVKPAIYVGPLFDIFEYLQDKHDGGEFNFMVRRGETMLLSELVGIAPLPSRRKALEAHKLKYGW